MAKLLQTPLDAPHPPTLNVWEKMLWRWLRALRDDVLHEIQGRIMDELAKRCEVKL